jgi:sugar phosphate isomerase/epimerase
MLRAVSTYVYVKERLHPGLLDELVKAGAQTIEIFAARQHFDYANRKQHVHEIADWFHSSGIPLNSMHAPLYSDYDWGRSGSPPVDIAATDRAGRIDAMDEIKRALEVAELIPFHFLVVHLGDRDDTWSPRALEFSMTALEHLRAFANPLGVKLVVENLQNEVTRPVYILEILNTGHFTDIGVCLDVGHAHLGAGLTATLEELKPRIRTAHLHDNHGQKDEHLWPGEGTLAWNEVYEGLKSAPQSPAGVLEIHYALDEAPETVAQKATKAFERF